MFGQILHCPLDDRRLVWLGYRGRYKDIPDTEIYYCPCCDVALMHIFDPASTVIQWHRVNGEMVLREQDWIVKSRFDAEAWRVRESNLRHWVRAFLAQRDSSTLLCHNDGSKAFLLKESFADRTIPVRFVWCRWCTEGFMFCRDSVYGWEAIARFVLNKEQRPEVVEVYDINANIQFSDQWLNLLQSDE